IFESISSRFPGNSLETCAYIGLPLLGIVVWLSCTRWRQPTTKLLCTFFAVVCLLMLGPRLHVGGIELLGMPWKLGLQLPLVRHALPVQFSIYAVLTVAITVSM